MEPTSVTHRLPARARRVLALELLERQGSVSVAELAAKTGVSAMTVRRDLDELERRGAVVRGRGKALTPVSRSYEPPLDLRLTERVEEKRRIGAEAAQLIGDGETVMLDVGSTSLAVARALAGRRNLTVLTSSLPIAAELAGESGIRLMMTGGILRPGERSLVGDLAVESFRDLLFDTLVLGVGGIEPKHGLTEYNLDDARVKRAAIEIAGRIIVVADSEKIGRVAFARICPLSRASILVTDDNVPEEFVEQAQDLGVEVRIA